MFLQDYLVACSSVSCCDLIMACTICTPVAAPYACSLAQTEFLNLLSSDRLLPLVRFPLMNDEELTALSRHPLRRRSVVLGTLLAEARACHAAGEARQLHSGADSVQQVGSPVAVLRACLLGPCQRRGEAAACACRWRCDEVLASCCWWVRCSCVSPCAIPPMAVSCAGACGPPGGGGHAPCAAANLVPGCRRFQAAAAAARLTRHGAHVCLEW